MHRDVIESLKTSSLDFSNESKLDFQHKLLSNRDRKIIVDIRRELEECDEFIISVAFLTESGVTLILEQLKLLEAKGVKGKILTGDYLSFTEPKALEKLLSFNNIEVKLLTESKFHAKGYFFKKKDVWSFIVGSSNLTGTALTVNFEWNLKVSSLVTGKIAKDILNEFKLVYNALPELTSNILNRYKEVYELSKQLKIKKNQINGDLLEIKPNKMQELALLGLEEARGKGDRALLISATGTGKTYLSAFHILETKPTKVLFLAHRKTILKKSLNSFKHILKDKKMGIYGEFENGENDLVFGMIQTLSRDEHLLKFEKDYFDYIVVDEVHHGGAKSYRKILDYFKPKFLLGMTATPERGDDFDIYELFNHNIAYEIRLNDALNEGLLCPFHYFGISDIKIEGKEIDEKTSIKDLVLDERVEHIIEKSRYYGYSGEKLHGLIFVSRIDEAEILAEKLTERGIKSKALSGETTDKERETAIKELEHGEIEYLITVDIFNEGVDIPAVNQVIFLRPTESSIVYIQQLGRGLRKSGNKEFVVILDFIGNYQKNFLIPTAISGRNSFDRDDMKMFLINGTNIIPGESSITFEKIVRERIFENINKTNFSTKKMIESDFEILEKQLGRVPFLNDFYERKLIDPLVILKFRKTYDEVLKTIKPNLNLGSLNEAEKNYLTFLSSIFTPAKRVHEMLILQYLIENRKVTVKEVLKVLEERYSLFNQEKNIENALKHLEKDIFKSLSTIKEYKPLVEKLDEENIWVIKKGFIESYKTNSYFKVLIDDLLKYNLNSSKDNYKNFSKEGVIKYKSYSKQEAFWYMNLDFNNGYQVSGYTIFEKEKKVMIFITLDDSTPFTAYDNIFYDRQHFNWFSKSNRCLNRNGKLTGEGRIAQNEFTIEVFLKKKMGENFFYLGEVLRVEKAEEILGKKGEPLVQYDLILKDEIDKDLFDYFNLN
ncbi:DEAD/DEAH box helicase [Cetobacterium sp.]|uniref:DEAD/DEAH box helicase n=1 Tax=Cetobacterium sp. TaxID=2071632 RepID=UPI003F384435